MRSPWANRRAHSAGIRMKSVWQPPLRGGKQAVYFTDEWPVVVGFGHKLLGGNRTTELPYFAENNDRGVISVGNRAKIVRQFAVAAVVTFRVENDQIGMQIASNLNGVFGPFGFHRFCASALQQQS